jgi:hypothetical protein
VQAHTALARNTYANHPRLNALAAKYAKAPAQMLIRYSLQKGWTPVVGARDPAHLVSNAGAEAEGFEIEKEDMVEMDGWDRGSEGAVRKLCGWKRFEGCADFVSPVVEERVRDQCMAVGLEGNGEYEAIVCRFSVDYKKELLDLLCILIRPSSIKHDFILLSSTQVNSTTLRRPHLHAEAPKRTLPTTSPSSTMIPVPPGTEY